MDKRQAGWLAGWMDEWIKEGREEGKKSQMHLFIDTTDHIHKLEPRLPGEI